MDTLVNSGNLRSMHKRANPTNYDVINVMNSMPNATATRMLNLNGDYTIDVSKNTLDVVLPYFGRMFNPTFGSASDNSYRFTSKDFTVTKTQNKKELDF